MAYALNELAGVWMKVLFNPKEGVKDVMARNPELGDGLIAGAVAGGAAGLIGGILGFIITLVFGLGFLGLIYLILGPIMGVIAGALCVLIGAVVYYIIAMLFGGKADFGQFCGAYGVSVSSIFLLSLAASLTNSVISMAAGGAMLSSAFSGSYGAAAGAFGTLMIVQAIFLIIGLIIMVYGVFIISKVIEAVYGFDSGKALLVAAIPIILVESINLYYFLFVVK